MTVFINLKLIKQVAFYKIMTIFSHSLYLSHCKLEMYMYFNIPANMYMYFNILANNVFYYFFIIFILIFYYFMGQNCHTVTNARNAEYWHLHLQAFT